MERTSWQNPWIRAATTLLTLAMMIMIFCLSMENAEKSDRRSGVFSECVVRFFCPEYDLLDAAEQRTVFDRIQHIVRKCAHFSEYSALGFLIRLCIESWFGYRTGKSRYLTLAGFGVGAGYACTDEAHQLAIDGRSGQWSDVFVDSCGVLAGVMLGSLLIRKLKKKNTARTWTDNKTGENKDGIFQEQ